MFVVRCKGTGEAVIIDAANEHELLLEVSRATGVRRVLTTHGHWDHIQAVDGDARRRHRRRHRRRGRDDAAGLRLRDPRRRGDRGRRPAAAHHPQPGPHRRAPRRSCSRATRSCSAATPSSPAAPATRSCPGGDFDQIIESIDRRLFTLPADLLVLPGHGLDTTIGTERPHLQEWVDRAGSTAHSHGRVTLRANDDCWCGSGKKYKRCHKAALLQRGHGRPRARGARRHRAPRLRRRPVHPVRTTESAVKSPDVIERMRVAGRIARDVLHETGAAVAPGITTDELDRVAHEAHVARGVYPSPLALQGLPEVGVHVGQRGHLPRHPRRPRARRGRHRQPRHHRLRRRRARRHQRDVLRRHGRRRSRGAW